jgi:hypothetical protein
VPSDDERKQGVGPGAGTSPWAVLAAAVALQALTGPGQTVGVSVFVDHLVADLELSRSAVSAAYLVGTLAGAASNASRALTCTFTNRPTQDATHCKACGQLKTRWSSSLRKMLGGMGKTSYAGWRYSCPRPCSPKPSTDP